MDLFDYYARNGYDEHMTNDLEYAGPALMWDAFESLRRSSQGANVSNSGFLNTVDASHKVRLAELGCGTGLVGNLFRQNGFSGSLYGCDLSPVMVDTAAQLQFNSSQVYDAVYPLDCVDFLRSFQGLVTQKFLFRFFSISFFSEHRYS